VNNGESQTYTCVAWKNGGRNEMLIAKGEEREQIVLARFDMDEIRAFRNAESWRMDCRGRGARHHPC
jgi:hypothetical protein